jgi:SAM-dependent methyltransferase
MFSEAPELYDLIYQSFKNYAAEASQIADLLATEAPGAKVVLDVGCGTGEHARYLLGEHGYQVHGIDLEPAFIELARAKVPQASFWHGDMADFALDTSYDAILCLFSSIGYLCSLDRVERAFTCFRKHLNPAGVVIVEPWFEPEAWRPGRTYLNTVEADDLRVVRLSHSGIRGCTSIVTFHYLIGSEEGIEHRTEHHELALFTRPEMMECFARAGFGDVSYDPKGLIGRGMYVARVEG